MGECAWGGSSGGPRVGEEGPRRHSQGAFEEEGGALEGGETRVEGERACVLVNEWRLNEHKRGWTAGGPGGMREQRVAGGAGQGIAQVESGEGGGGAEAEGEGRSTGRMRECTALPLSARFPLAIHPPFRHIPFAPHLPLAPARRYGLGPSTSGVGWGAAGPFQRAAGLPQRLYREKVRVEGMRGTRMGGRCRPGSHRRGGIGPRRGGAAPRMPAPS